VFSNFHSVSPLKFISILYYQPLIVNKIIFFFYLTIISTNGSLGETLKRETIKTQIVADWTARRFGIVKSQQKAKGFLGKASHQTQKRCFCNMVDGGKIGATILICVSTKTIGSA